MKSALPKGVSAVGEMWTAKERKDYIERERSIYPLGREMLQAILGKEEGDRVADELALHDFTLLHESDYSYIE